MPSIQNKTFDEINLGDIASTQRTLQARDIQAWAAAFGEVGPLVEIGGIPGAAGIITGFLTSLVGSALPGPGSRIHSTAVQLCAALPIDAALTVQLVVREKRANERLVILAGHCRNPSGQQVATAVIEVVAPTQRQQCEVAEHRLEGLLERCRNSGELLHRVERERFGFDHADVGGALLRRWKIPARVAQPVERHHDSQKAEQYPREASILHFADIVAHALQIGNSGELLVPKLDSSVWERLNVSCHYLPTLVQQVDATFNDIVRVLFKGDASA